MPLDSFQTAQMLNSSMAMLGNQRAFSQQISNPGSMGVMATPQAPNPIYQGAMGLMGGLMAPPMPGTTEAGLWGQQMGMQAMGMFISPQTPLIGQAFQNQQQQLGLSQMMSQNFAFARPGGTGFTGGQLGAMSNFVQQQARTNPMWSTQEMNRVAAGGLQMGMFNQTRSVTQFQQQFRQLLNTLDMVTKTVGGTIEEAMQRIQTLRSSGIFNTADQMRIMQGLPGMAAAGGVPVSQLMAFGGQVGQMLRPLGVTAPQGMRAGIQSLGLMGTANQMGALTNQALWQATGATGIEGLSALATRATGVAANFTMRGAGRVFTAAFFDPATGQFQEDTFKRWQSGLMTPGEIANLASRNVSRMGLEEFRAREGEMRGEFMSKAGPLAPFQIMKQALPAGFTDPYRTQLFLKQRFKLTTAEAAAFQPILEQLPQLENEYQMAASQAQKDAEQRAAWEARTPGARAQASMKQLREATVGRIGKITDMFRDAIAKGVQRGVERSTGYYEDMVSRDLIQAAGQGIFRTTAVGTGFGGLPTGLGQQMAQARGMMKGPDLPTWGGRGGAITGGQALAAAGVMAGGPLSWAKNYRTLTSTISGVSAGMGRLAESAAYNVSNFLGYGTQVLGVGKTPFTYNQDELRLLGFKATQTAKASDTAEQLAQQYRTKMGGGMVFTTGATGFLALGGSAADIERARDLQSGNIRPDKWGFTQTEWNNAVGKSGVALQVGEMLDKGAKFTDVVDFVKKKTGLTGDKAGAAAMEYVRRNTIGGAKYFGIGIEGDPISRGNAIKAGLQGLSDATKISQDQIQAYLNDPSINAQIREAVNASPAVKDKILASIMEQGRISGDDKLMTLAKTLRSDPGAFQKAGQAAGGLFYNAGIKAMEPFRPMAEKIMGVKGAKGLLATLQTEQMSALAQGKWEKMTGDPLAEMQKNLREFVFESGTNRKKIKSEIAYLRDIGQTQLANYLESEYNTYTKVKSTQGRVRVQSAKTLAALLEPDSEKREKLFQNIISSKQVPSEIYKSKIAELEGLKQTPYYQGHWVTDVERTKWQGEIEQLKTLGAAAGTGKEATAAQMDLEQQKAKGGGAGASKGLEITKLPEKVETALMNLDVTMKDVRTFMQKDTAAEEGLVGTLKGLLKKEE